MEQTWSSDLLHAVETKNNLELHRAINALFEPAGVTVGGLTFAHRVIKRASTSTSAQPLILYSISSNEPWDPLAVLWIQRQLLPHSSNWDSFSSQLAIKLSPYYRGHTLSPKINIFFQQNMSGIDLGWQPPVRLPDTCVSSQISQSYIYIPTTRRIVTITTDGSRFILEGEPVLHYNAHRPLLPPRFEVLRDYVALTKLYTNLGLSPRSIIDPVIFAYGKLLEHAIGSPYYKLRLLLADHFQEVQKRLPIESPWRCVAVVDRIS